MHFFLLYILCKISLSYIYCYYDTQVSLDYYPFLLFNLFANFVSLLSSFLIVVRLHVIVIVIRSYLIIVQQAYVCIDAILLGNASLLVSSCVVIENISVNRSSSVRGCCVPFSCDCHFISPCFLISRVMFH